MGCKYFLNPQSALPPKGNTPRSTSIDFVENQLSPSLIGLSPLTTSHPSIFPHTRVRSSSTFYHTFNLLIVRSPGFGSNLNNLKLLSNLLSLRFHFFLLSLLYKLSHWLIMQKVHCRHFGFNCLETLCFKFYIIKINIFFPLRYLFTIGY